MPHYKEMSAADILSDLQGRKGSDLEKQVKSLLYKKANRPEDIAEQRALFQGLHTLPGLSRFEQTYALIAATHKASELCLPEAVAANAPALWDCYDWAKGLPGKTELRKDGNHLRFSILYVLMNGGVLTQAKDLPQTAQTVLKALATINPRQTTHYSFNTTTNILNIVGLALLVERDRLPDTVPLLSALMFHALRMKFTHGALKSYFHIGHPEKLSDIEPPSNFVKFEESFRKFLIIKSAAEDPQGLYAPQAFWDVARECVPDWTEAQKQAHLQALAQLTPDAGPPLP
ncbi:hypothetical protein [Pacificoceanicola onchidii]|uniref:hypothetical protein n=1 Tax=Pacificoceanicola onchidii TaxID=2562685 RepID=UPI0010A5A778|nr:hypothetical protein [Pacificoceanicola onchidii]